MKIHRRSQSSPAPLAASLLALALVPAGCSKNMEGEDMAGAQDGGGGTFYAIASTLNANTRMATSVIYTTPSLAEGATVDQSKAISVPDVVSLFGIPGSGRAYGSQAMTPTVTRYEIDTRGTITPGPAVSFARFGLGARFSTRSIVLASPTKGYLLDDTSLQAITFDPTEMTTGKAIDLSAMREMGYGTNFSYTIPVRGGTQIVVAAYYYDPTFSQTIAKTAVALIDTATDTATVIKDSRCGAFSTAATAPNGDIYFALDTYAAALNRIGGEAASPEGCLLRIKSGENVFDPSFLLKTKDITGTKAGGGVVPGPGNSIWVRGYDETVVPVTMTTTAIQFFGAQAWKWWKVDLQNPTAPGVVSAFPPSAGQLKYFLVEGRALVNNEGADFMSTIEVDMTSMGAPLRGATLKGQTAGIVKVR